MAKSRVATRGLKKRRAYRARVKRSSCRGKRGRTCNKTKGCKYTRGKKRRYCRKSKNRKYTEMCFELIKKQAIESGCNKIVFKNTNQNFLRLMKPLGFKQGEMEFICEI